ncbi:hypothetical protein ACFX2K_018756 [Malus domestica]
MARNLENFMSENSNIQEMGQRRSTRLNVILEGSAPTPRVSTTGSIAVVTSVATPSKVYGAFTTARAVPSKAAHGTKATTQASLLHALCTEQPIFVAQPTPAEQPTLMAQPAPTEQSTFVAQPTLAKQPTRVAQPAPVAFQVA